MILPWLRQINTNNVQNVHKSEDVQSESDAVDEECDREKAWMIDFVATKSIWTIDLVMLLQHFLSSDRTSIDCTTKDDGRCPDQHKCYCPHQLSKNSSSPIASWSYLFCSTKFEVDESYNTLGYYKDAFCSDEQRVKMLFDVAKKQQLPLLRTEHISLDVLVDIISRKDVVAIVLLDNKILRNNDSSYSGHYVILCGVSNDENDIECAQINSPEDDNSTKYQFCMVVKNPGLWKRIEYVSPSRFEKAWRATGTDEDVIFLAKHI